MQENFPPTRIDLSQFPKSLANIIKATGTLWSISSLMDTYFVAEIA